MVALLFPHSLGYSRSRQGNHGEAASIGRVVHEGNPNPTRASKNGKLILDMFQSPSADAKRGVKRLSGQDD